MSTRFDFGEIEMIKQAAAVKQWSLAQLVRVGAYEKAVNILNATGDRMYTVRSGVAPIVQTLLTEFDAQMLSEMACDLMQGEGGTWPGLQDGQFARFVELVRKLGSELAPILEAESTRVGTRREIFPPLIDPNPPFSEPVSPAMMGTNRAVESTVESSTVIRSGSHRRTRRKAKGVR